MESILFTPFTYEGSGLRAFMKISPIDMFQIKKLAPGSEDFAIVWDEVCGKKWVIGRQSDGEFVVFCPADDDEFCELCDDCKAARECENLVN